MTTVGPLAGIGVLVTRPREQAGQLRESLLALGATPLLFPALAILPAINPDALLEVLGRIDRYDLHLFVSPAAVRFGLAALSGDAVLKLRPAAVGNGTAAALRAAGCGDVLVPDAGADSEHLLALPALANMAAKRVLIFRGEGGRELIADSLRARGAEVEYAEIYRRGCPQVDMMPLRRMLDRHQVQAVTVFSRETLDNLLRMGGADTAESLRALPLFAPHPRIAAHALALNFDNAITTAPGDIGVVAGLVEYFRHD